MPSARAQSCQLFLLVCSLSSQGRDGNVKFWQLDASLASISQQEMQINTGAFSFCRCAAAPVQVCADSLPEPRTCAAPCADCLFSQTYGVYWVVTIRLPAMLHKVLTGCASLAEDCINVDCIDWRSTD